MLAFGFTYNSDFLHYSSELLPALLIALGFLLFVGEVQGRREVRPSPRAAQLFLCGIALGMTPWCKLQALPIAGVLVAAVSGHILYYRDRNPLFPFQLARFWAGVVLPSAAMFSIVVKGGAVRDFWNSYILGNMAYAGPIQLPKIISCMKYQLWLPEVNLLTVLIPLAVLSLLFLNMWRHALPGFTPEEKWVLGTTVCLAGSALFAVCRPMLPFSHYAIFLLLPMTCLSVLLLSKAFGMIAIQEKGRARQAVNILVSVVAVLLFAYTGLRIMVLHKLPQPQPNASERIAAEIQEMKQARQINSLEIWGWEPGVYVLTGMPPATRDAIGHFVISLGSSHPYFRERFLDDLRKEPPDLFVDAVAEGAFLWDWSEHDGYESDPGLKTFIEERYVLVTELPLSVGAKPVRFFERR
jgi:hypothetical protein